MKGLILALLFSLLIFPIVNIQASLQGYNISSHGEISYLKSNIFGVQIWWDITTKQKNYTIQLGVAWARTGNAGSWRFIEPKQGVFDWAKTDAIVNFLRSNGIEPLIVCASTPQWASTNPDATNFYSYAPTNMDWYENFVHQIVKRYNLKVVEIWNEPKMFFTGTYDEYVALTKAGYEGAKAANPNCIVIGTWGGGAIWGDYNPYGTWGIGHLVDRGFLNYVDALAIHPYTGATPPEDVIPSQLQKLEEYLASKGKTNFPLYVTEFGYGLGTAWFAGGHTLESQADFTVRATNLLFNDPYVKMIVYFTLYGSYVPDEQMDLLDQSTGNPRPVYYSYQNFIKEHSGS